MNKHTLTAAILIGLAALHSPAFAGIGEETAEAMTRQYQDTREVCGEHSPAFVCSGILLRATTPSERYHSWDHSPNSKEKGGVAFSYLRADAHIAHLAADARSGYTLAPVKLRPEDTLQYRVLCAFPTDGDSWTRDRGGCGDNAQTAKVEQFCHESGIATAEDWVGHYESTPGDRDRRYFEQCAFDMDSARDMAATTEFMEALKAMRSLDGQPFPWNEILIGTWDETQGHRLPIQSFFHIKWKQGALAQARYDQQDFYKTTGRFVPIIEIDLNHEDSKSARFTYRASDQTIDEPTQSD